MPSRKPDDPASDVPLRRWDIYQVRAKAALLGVVHAPDEASAISKAAEHYGKDPKRLIAVPIPSRRP
jgi:hypothetical protein